MTGKRPKTPVPRILVAADQPQLLTGALGPGFQNQTNYLRFHMARLHRKLEGDPSRLRHLPTEPGMSYRCQP